MCVHCHRKLFTKQLYSNSSGIIDVFTIHYQATHVPFLQSLYSNSCACYSISRHAMTASFNILSNSSFIITQTSDTIQPDSTVKLSGLDLSLVLLWCWWLDLHLGVMLFIFKLCQSGSVEPEHILAELCDIHIINIK
jgi:hypothetical protein